jgi:hypothetical protein
MGLPEYRIGLDAIHPKHGNSYKSTQLIEASCINISTPDLFFFVQFNTIAVSAVCGAKLIAIPRRPVINAARIAIILFILQIMN